MSIRAKMTLFVLLVSLSQAILLGVIGYNSVSIISGNAAELRRIASVIEGTRALNASLTALSDPDEILSPDASDPPARFAARMDEIERQVETCAATSCHGYEKRPPQMARDLLADLRRIRADGTRVLSAGSPAGGPGPIEWLERVDGPVHRLSRTTREMSETLAVRAKDIEASSRKAERTATWLIGGMTLFCFIIAVGLCTPIARGIARPLEKLAAQTRSIGGGEAPMRVEESGPREVASVARAFNRMLDDLGRHQSLLEHTVGERVAELRRKDEELKRTGKLASIGLIAGTVAHDLNNPLTSLLLNAEVLGQSIPATDRNRAVLDDLTKDARRCRQIASEIRALSREAEIERIPCDAGQVAGEAARLLRFKAEPRRVALMLELPEGPTSCLCAPAQLLQLFVNLIENAIDASSDGGTVEIRVQPVGGQLRIEVQDHGSGIRPEHRASIFKILFTTKHLGTGLGLAICHRIVEQHEGAIEFETRTSGESPEVHGTTFRVLLPLSRTGKETSCEHGSQRPHCR